MIVAAPLSLSPSSLVANRIESSDLPAVVEAHVPDVLKKKQVSQGG